MAKIPFTKLNLKKDNNIKILNWENQQIEIKQYLPIENKMQLISNVINLSLDDHVFVNPCKVHIFETIQLILNYTNINLTDKQAEDTLKLYDLFSGEFLNKIKENIPVAELEFIHQGILDTIHEIYTYKNSFAGMIEQTQINYKDIEEQVKALEDKVTDQNSFPVLKEVITNFN